MALLTCFCLWGGMRPVQELRCRSDFFCCRSLCLQPPQLYGCSFIFSRYMATTQFEATDARAAFPCFDEPEFKSQFIVTLVHEKGYSALSNMPVEKVITRDDGFMESHFKESVKMSTYLLAFIVCDFAYKETHSKAGKKVGVIEAIKCLHFSVVLCLLC